MKQFGCAIGGFLLIVIVLVAVGWVVEGNDFFLYQYFAPKRAEVERKVFEGTHSYNQGMKQELENMRFDYLKQTTPEAKKAMASVILHRVGDYDETKLPADLRSFIQGLRQEQNQPNR